VTLSPEEREELRRNEQWFHDWPCQDPSPELEAVRAGVRMALEEARIGARLAEGPPAPSRMTDRLKTMVRAEVFAERDQREIGGAEEGERTGWAAKGAGTAGWRRRPWRRWTAVAGLAAAACIAGVIVLSPASAPDIKPIEYARAFEAFTDDEWTESMTVLEESLRKLEAAVAGSGRSESPYAEPASEGEDDLEEVWMELLSDDRPS